MVVVLVHRHEVARREVLFERTCGACFVGHEGKATHAARHSKLELVVSVWWWW